MCAISGHSGRPHYGRGDTWRWFTPFVPDLSLPLQRLHWVWGKAFTAIIPVSHCHGNTVCYVTLRFFFISSSGGRAPRPPHSSSLRECDKHCIQTVWRLVKCVSMSTAGSLKQMWGTNGMARCLHVLLFVCYKVTFIWSAASSKIWLAVSKGTDLCRWLLEEYKSRGLPATMKPQQKSDTFSPT